MVQMVSTPSTDAPPAVTRSERPLTADERERLSRSLRNQSLLSHALLFLALLGFGAACGLGWTMKSHRGQAALPALGAGFVLVLRQTVASDPGRRRDLEGGYKIALRGPLEALSSIPHRGLIVVRLRVGSEALKMYRRKPPGWTVGEMVEVHFTLASREVLWAAREGSTDAAD